MLHARLIRPLLVAALTAAAGCALALAGPAEASAARTGPPTVPAAGPSQQSAGAGCPAGMRAWVPSAQALAAGDARAVAPATMSPSGRAAFGAQVLRLIAGHHVRWLGSTGCGSTDRYSGQPRAGQPAGPAVGSRSAGHPNAAQMASGSSNNWSGYQSNVGQFSGASMVWTVPVLQPTASPAAVSIWPGIGGGLPSADKLIQAGSEQDANGTHAWTEVFPDQPQQNVSGFSLAPGNTLAVTVSWDSVGHTAAFLLVNYTTGVAKEISQPVSGVSGDTAEWIVERTELCASGYCVFPRIENFGSQVISAGYAQQTKKDPTTNQYVTTGNYLGQFSPIADQLTPCIGSPTMASVSPAGTTGTFTDTFQNAGIVDPSRCTWVESPLSAPFTATLSSTSTFTVTDTTANFPIGCGTASLSGITAASAPVQAPGANTFLYVSKVSAGACTNANGGVWTVTPSGYYTWDISADAASESPVTTGDITGISGAPLVLDVSGTAFSEPCSFTLTGPAPPGSVTYTSPSKLFISTASLKVSNVTGVGCAANGVGIKNGDSAALSASYQMTTPSGGVTFTPPSS